jgi:solute carrier family 25 oxoglutarate transporter 11
MTEIKIEKTGWQKFLDTAQPFWIGGLSGMLATCVIQPVDMIKIIIQLKSEELARTKQQGSVSFFSALRDIYSSEGIKGFYRGYLICNFSIDSALARQIFYTTTRMGVYKTLTEYVQDQNKAAGISTCSINKDSLSLFQKAYSASIAGFVGSIVGNPADLSLVRMQADNQLPVAERRNYKNVFNAFSRITSEEGFFALWRGSTPTIIRAVVLNLAMLASYD